MQQIHSNYIRQIFMLLLMIIIGGLIFFELLPYLSGVLGAITIYVLLRGWMEQLLKRGWNANLAAIFLCLLSFIGILIPVSGVLLLLGNKIGKAVNNSEKVVNAFKDQMIVWENRLDFDLVSQIDASGISSWLSKSLQNFAGGTFDVFIAIGLMYFILFYLLKDSISAKNSMGKFIPVTKDNFDLIGKDMNAMVRANALGIPLVAIAQGIVALIGFLIFGVQDPFFWFVIVTIGSMIPFVGTLLGIVPVFFLELSMGHNFTAWGILIYGLVVVGATDNLIRLFVLKKLDNIHPLITLTGVIIGVPLFGFIGLIFGPLMISLFLILVSIYRKEYPQSAD